MSASKAVYKGKTIIKTPEGFSVNGKIYATIELATKAINR